MDDATREQERVRLARLRALPSIDELLDRPSLSMVLATVSRPVAVQALRRAVSQTRARVMAGEDASVDEPTVREAVRREASPNLRPVINATGVVLHTNLGRAPLAPRALERVASVASGYCNLELELDEGERGSRYAAVVELLERLTGAQAAMVVNNCASAVLLTLSALAAGREAVISRGELVEIGGGFRVPEVMRQSGATMVEVGTTNRTRLSDYERAHGPNTAALVKVHQSNFAVVGFTESTPTAALARFGRQVGCPVYEDLGSGALEPIFGERTVRDAVAEGADLVSFSGDKLLGGPQAGIIVGRAELISRLERHPLNRAVRIDKVTLAALEATLELYRDGVADDAVPTRRLLLQPAATIEARARGVSAALTEVPHQVRDVEGQVGGGCLPRQSLPSWAVAVTQGDAARMHSTLRSGIPAIVGRVGGGTLLLDLRCVADTELAALTTAVKAAYRQET